MDFLQMLLSVKYINNALHILNSLVLNFPEKVSNVEGNLILYNPFFLIDANTKQSYSQSFDEKSKGASIQISINSPPQFSFNFRYPIVSVAKVTFSEKIELLFNKKELKYTLPPNTNLPISLTNIEVEKSGPVLHFWLKVNGNLKVNKAKITIKCQSTSGLNTLSKYNGIILDQKALEKTRFDIPFVGNNACLQGLNVGLIVIEIDVLDGEKTLIKYFPYYSIQ